MGSYFTATRSIVTTRMEGAPEAVDVLKKLEYAARRRVVSAALRASNAVIVRQAKAMAPVGKTGLLRKQIRGTVKADPRAGVIYATIRSGATKAMRRKGVATASKYAHLVIGGTKPHDIQVTQGGPRGLATPGGFYTRIHHPGAKPRPFMEQAADLAFQEAINAFGFKMDEALAKEVDKVRRAHLADADLAKMGAPF